MKQPPASRNRRRRRGLTLVELTLSIMIIALIGGAIAAMLDAVAYGTQDSQNLRRLVARKQAMSHRLTDALRSARMVLERGDRYVIVWMEDLDDDGQPSLLELQRIDFDPDTGAVVRASPRTDLSAAQRDVLGVPRDLDSHFATLTRQAITQGLWREQTLTRDVASFKVTLNASQPQNATLLSLALTLREVGMEDLALVAVSLPNHPTR